MELISYWWSKIFKQYLLFFSLLSLSFQSFTQEREQAQTPEIFLARDSSYSFYLPKTYSGQNSYPLIIFLDPASMGTRVIRKYTEVAEKAGIIIAASLTSKNFGNEHTLQAVFSIYKNMVKEFSVDTQRVWLAGFSGGARAACSFGIKNNFIKGVIACGAGFAGDEIISPWRTIPFAGIAGDKDMNYEELFGISEYLDGINNPNIMLTFQGGHDWPPKEYFELAVSWLMRDEDKAKKKLIINNSDIVHAINVKINSGQLFQPYYEAQQLKKIPFLYRVADSIASGLEANPKFAIDQLSYLAIISEERAYMDGYSLLFNELIKNNEVVKLKNGDWSSRALQIKDILQSNEPYRRVSGLRRLDFSLRTCLEYYFQFVSVNEYIKAYNVANVMSFFKSNNEPYFLMAKAAAGQKNKKLSEKCLRMYLKKSEVRETEVLNEPLFAGIFTREELKSILQIKN